MNAELPLCLCGCGMRVSKPRNRYILGHSGIIGKPVWNTGKHLSYELKLKISKANKGRLPPNTGNRHSEETKLKMSKLAMGRVATPETKLKLSRASKGNKWNCGRLASEETKLKMSKSRKGILLGRPSPTKGTKLSEETKRKMRVAAIRITENQKLHGEPLCPRIGFKERPCLDELEQFTPNKKIIRNSHDYAYTAGRFPDGEVDGLPIILIQFNESFHFLDKETMTILDEKTIQTTLDLASNRDNGPKIVFNISEYDWENNKENIIEQFKILLDETKDIIDDNLKTVIL